MTPTDPRELGQAIAALRGQQSQAEAARRAGMSRGAWSLYELGRRRPREANLERILLGLNRTREELEEAVCKVHRWRLVEEALELGFWPRSATPGETSPRQRAPARRYPAGRTSLGPKRSCPIRSPETASLQRGRGPFLPFVEDLDALF